MLSFHRFSLVFLGSCGFLTAAAVQGVAAPLTLTGSYLQVGISDYGTFGSNGSTEPGLLHDPTGTGSFYPGGIPNDYLTPGTPHDGFAVTSTQTGTINNDNDGLSGFGTTSPVLLTGAAAQGYQNAASWTGTVGTSFTINNSYFFNTGDEQIKIITTITALTNLTNVAFARSEDPDPDEIRYGSFATINTRGDSVNAPQDLVSAAGESTGLTIGILNLSGSTYVHNTEITANCCSTDDPANILANTSTLAYPTTTTGDYGLQIAWLLGNLTAGQSDVIDYSYVFGTHQSTVSVPVTSSMTTAIGTTGGDISANTFSLGSAAANASSVQFDGGVLQLSGGSFAGNIIAAPVSIDANNGTIDTSTGSGGFSGTVSGPGSLTIQGGNTFSLTGANTFSGGVVVNASTVAVGNNTALGTGTLTLNAATLQAAADGLTLANAAVLSGSSVVDTQSFGLTYSGTISGSGSLSKIGSGTLTLPGANSYTGGTTLNAGTLAIGDGGALGTGGLTLNSGTLQVTQGSVIAVANAIQVTSAGGTIDQNQGAVQLTGGIAGPGSVTYANTGGTPINQNITSSNSIDLKTTNSYSGGSIVQSAAVVLVDATNALGTGSLEVDSGGTVDLNGVDQRVTTLTGSGIIFNAGDPGGAVGSVTLNMLTVANGAYAGVLDSGHHSIADGLSHGDIVLVKVSDGTASGGTLTLSGNNGFGDEGGGTLLEGGTLAVGSNKALGVGALVMSSGTTLQAAADGLTLANAITLNGADTVDTQSFTNGFGLSGVISGTGMLVKTGSSGLGLDVANSYSGGTLVQDGQVTLRNSVGFGTGAVTFAGGGLRAGVDGLIVGNAATLSSDTTFNTQGYGLTYAGTIAGPGRLTKIGTGTLSLPNANGYTGGTTLTAGTIAIGNGAALGTGAITINAGTLQATAAGLTVANAVALAGSGTIDTQANALALTGAVSGSGSLTKVGSGSLALTAAGSYTGGTVLTSGTLAVGNGAALGTGALQMADGTTLQFLASGLNFANAIAFTGNGDPTIDTGSGTETVSGPISGASSLTKIGSGTLDLTGTDTYTGGTDIVGGTLLVDGSIANSAVTVENGATIGGGGSIGALSVQSGAVISPGVRTLTISGNLTLAGGATYQATVNADGTSSRLAVGGTAGLGGAALSILAGTGNYAKVTTATILTAAGGVSGTFGSTNLDTNLAFLIPSLSYTSNSVLLTLAPGPAAFESVAATPNQFGVAGAVASLGPQSSLFNAVLGQTQAGARQAYDALSGVTHSTTERIATGTTRMLTGLIIDRLIDVAGNGLSAQQVVDQFGTDSGVPALVRCYGPVAPVVPPPAPQSYTAWGEGFGTFGHTDGGANAGTSDRSTGGFILGIDTPLSGVGIDHWRAGVAVGYSDTFFSSRIDGGSGTVQSVYGSVYGGARYGAVDIRVGATVSGQQTDDQRRVAFPGFLEAEKSSNGGMTEQGFGEVGYRIPVQHVIVEPVLGASILHTHQDGFRENGGVAALVSNPTDNLLGITTLGVRGEITPFQGLPLVAHTLLGWQHVIGNVSPATTLAFEAAGSNSFSVTGAPLDRDALAAEASLDYRVSAALDIGLTYAGTIGATAYDHSVKGRMEYRF